MSRLVSYSCLGLLASLLTGCASPVSPSELRALREAEARWAARQFQSYSYETRMDCFCDQIASEWARVTVTGDVVTEVVLVANDSALGQPEFVRFSTVDTLFAQIHALLRSHDSYISDVDLKFDPALGYPMLINISCQPNIADCGSARYARNLTALP